MDMALELIADEGEFWQAGSDGPGRMMTLAELKGMFRGVIGVIPGGMTFTETGIVCEGNRVVIELTSEATLANGRPYRNRYCFFLDIAGGKIVGGKEYMDTQHAAKAFAG